VARSGYYKWHATRAARTERDQADQALAGKIQAIHTDSDGTYGSPRVTAELRDEHGMEINEKRVARVMRKFNIVGVHLRKKIRTTVPEPSDTPVPDLFKRDFTAPQPNVKYMGSGSRRESHPPAPTEPCVTVSRYTALVTLITRNYGTGANARTFPGIAV
jgi:transposase InsO family protein